jgi:hypothetical protein
LEPVSSIVPAPNGHGCIVQVEADMDNSLVGKTIAFQYETGAPPGTAIEIDFFSERQKTSRSLDPTNHWVATDDYDMAVIAVDIYMASWMGDDGHVVTAVFNLRNMTINSTYSSLDRLRIPMAGIITDVR